MAAASRTSDGSVGNAPCDDGREGAREGRDGKGREGEGPKLVMGAWGAGGCYGRRECVIPCHSGGAGLDRAGMG